MKKIILSMLLLLPLGLMAQVQKIAHVNYNEIINVMPELANYENEMSKLQLAFQQQMKAYEDEYTRKMTDYTSQADSLTENIKVLRMQEIQQIQERSENYYQVAQEDMQKKSEELQAPMRDKILKAIASVCEEDGYTYILNPQAIIHIGSNAIDITDKVKAKMGLK